MLSLVIPTLNEAANVGPLLQALRAATGDLGHEFIVVDDDSPDRTWEAAEAAGKAAGDVRVIRRVGRRGLSSAVTEGFAAAKGDVLMVMDADGQHDPSLIRRLHDAVKGGAVIAVASRYVEGGGTEGWDERRLLMSRIATSLARNLPPVRVTDPMSGFFAIDAAAYRKIESSLHPRGFKILLEILGHLPAGTRATELPLVFGLRTRGESKMNARVQLQFLWQIAGIALRRIQWVLCALVLAGIVLVSVLRIIPILPLYLDPGVRGRVQTAVTELSRVQGFIVSDLSIKRIAGDAVEVAVRRHHRGADQRVVLLLQP